MPFQLRIFEDLTNCNEAIHHSRPVFLQGCLACHTRWLLVASLCARDWRVFMAFQLSEDTVLSKHPFWVLQFSKEEKQSSFCSFCTCFYRAICKVTAVRWLLLEMRPGIISHLFNWLRSVYTRAVSMVNSHRCALYPVHAADVLGCSRKFSLKQSKFTYLVFCIM